MAAAELSTTNGANGLDAVTLRDRATRVASLVEGAALVFLADGGTQRLRSAAGVASPDLARRAAVAINEPVARVASEGKAIRAPAVAALEERGAGGFVLLPLATRRSLVGVLAVATPEELDATDLVALEFAAEALGAQIELASISDESSHLREQLDQTDRIAEEKSDEVLRLSEALFAQDIELLRSNERLGQVEKLKNDFIEKMSRELRTPLNSIIEAIIAVLAGENDVLSETAQQCLRRALDDGTAFLRTLQNILDLWRIKQGEMQVEVQDVNFREVVEEAIFSVQDTVGNNPVTIEKHFEEPLPKVKTDLAKVNHVLFLLLDNAAKFTRQGEIEIRARVEGGELVCEVKDSGIGICPDDQQFIFDEFYQVDDLASTKYRGSGLGLALVRDLLNLLDGGLSVTSEVGTGSSFTFHVPVQVVG
ncbi:MAG: ATP-binding protein [Myxococcota bacterium]|nr:ATP-binding protein [Myxococcota bacterium]